jgi:segregation and condensation protein B
VNRVIRLSEADMVDASEMEPAGQSESGAAAEPVTDSGTGAPVSGLDPMQVRILEALLFAAREPVEEPSLAGAFPQGTNVAALMAELVHQYQGRGVNLVKIAGKWQFRTAADLAFLLRKQAVEERRLSRAAIETLAIIAYHQPVTRAEIEDIRGVVVSKGTIDALMEAGWIRIRGRKRTPGRPVTYGTTEAFLSHFGLENIGHLPGLEDLKTAGFFDAVPPANFTVPNPSETLAPDEDPYEGDEGDIAAATADMLPAPPEAAPGGPSD